MPDTAISKYLEKYSEVFTLPQATDEWDAGLVIPACNEEAFLPECFRGLETAAQKTTKNFLVIFVINGRVDAPPHVHSSNDVCIGFLLSRGREISRSENLMLMGGECFDYLICDYAGEPHRFPSDQGVGLARKIGSDILCKLIHNNTVSSPWITHTDADALVPEDYFSNAPFTNQMNKKSTVAVFPFEHAEVSDLNSDGYNPEILNRAINDYHKYLHYYVEGLSKANSPYAHHTVGSTMSFDFDAYAKVRGYPKREAGEDFYLLNKLSKLGSVENLDLSPITLQGRPSDRVPFGTGQANRKLYELYQAGQEFQVYHPNCFKVLEAYLNCARAYYDDLDEFYFLLSLDDQCDGIIDDLEKFIEGVKKDFFTEIISASKRAKDKEGQLKHFNTWFDGFKTLKFVHWIRDEFCGTVPLDNI
jgi:hypothetical protein